MIEDTAICPASLSFIFKKIEDKDLIKSGSIGIGCTVDKNVVVTASTSDQNRLLFNNKEIQIPPVFRAIKQITSVSLKLSVKSLLPIGSGFGISGAATLAGLYAVNKLLNLNKSSIELNGIAHNAEIVEKTGLGTVATQTTGGFLIKKRAGIPSIFRRLNFSGKIIYATVIGTLKTPTILSSPLILKNINKEADTALNEISKKKYLTIEDVINISYKYCINSGLLKNSEARKIIEQIRNLNGAATMAILGKTVLSNVKPKQTKYPVFELQISNNKIQMIRNANQ